MLDTLDAKSGDASCTSYWSGAMKVRKSRLEVPADSFAGASSLMMVGRESSPWDSPNQISCVRVRAGT